MICQFWQYKCLHLKSVEVRAEHYTREVLQLFEWLLTLCQVGDVIQFLLVLGIANKIAVAKFNMFLLLLG